MNSDYPKFAVVGHPNKGKSSIVAVLAMDNSVQISDTPGTTSKKRFFPLKIDGNTIYELIDTPGFQRGRRVLAWLEQHEVSADKKQQIVQKFINEHKNDPKYNDEIELLEPLMKGAGIIYVVDGSKPYGKEYEADMEILRWTGQPSMALINHIHDSDYSQEWKRALGQYFKLVRTFNPMEVTINQHLNLLESMAQLNEEWTSSVKVSIALFKKHHAYKMKKSTQIITQLIDNSLSLTIEVAFKDEIPTTQEKENLENEYRERLRTLEKKSHQQIEKLWNHQKIQTEKSEGLFEELDLFSESSASAFGLSKNELVLRSALAGAGIDILSFGSTLFMGTILGATSAYFGFDKLQEVKVLGQTLGKKYLQIGPMENRNFPFILLSRVVYHTSEIATFSHAKQEYKINLMEENFKNRWLRDDLKNDLGKYHQLFSAKDKKKEEDLESYEVLINDILSRLI